MIKNYFITGATGAIGSSLVRILLEESDSIVWILLRANSEEQLTNRVEALTTFWNWETAKIEKMRDRLIPLSGDTDNAKFALSDSCYAKLSRECTHIIHCAGVVKMNLPLEVARRHALNSAKNVVELAIACREHGRTPKIEFVSTVGVSGRMIGSIPETWLTQPRDYHNSYEQSKAEAEDYLKNQVSAHQLSLTVHRPSMVVGDSTTGKIIHYQIFYYLCDFLTGSKTFRILPFLGNAALDIVPVDYVASALKWSSEQGELTSGRIFHLSSGRSSLKLSELKKIISGHFPFKISISVPPFVFLLILRIITVTFSGKIGRSLNAIPIFLDYLRDRKIFDNKQTTDFFADNLGPPLVPIEEYLHLIISAYYHKKLSS